MEDKAEAAIMRVVNNTESRTGFSFAFLAPLLVQLLAQWVNCGEPDPGRLVDHLAAEIYRKAKRVRRKQKRRGIPQDPEISIAVARQIARDAIDEWNESDTGIQVALRAVVSRVDLFDESEE